MERIPTRSPIKVEDIVLRKSDKARFDPRTGEEIKNKFVAVIFSTIEQQFTSSGRPTTKKRTVSEPQGNMTLREAREVYAPGMTFSSDELILVKLQENEAREWNHFDSQTGAEVSDTIDHSYAVVHPALYEQHKARQQMLSRHRARRQAALQGSDSIDSNSLESQVFDDKAPRTNDLQSQS